MKSHIYNVGNPMRTVLLLLVLTSISAGQLKYDRGVDWNLPDAVQKRMEDGHMFEQYTLSDHVNPFYLRGDFDGDGKPDYAVLIVNKSSRKTALAISLSTLNAIQLLGANGKKLRVGSQADSYDLSDFDWMDAWQVYDHTELTPNELNDKSTLGRMAGEGLLVEKTEAASSLIYWDGTKFRWYQLSD